MDFKRGDTFYFSATLPDSWPDGSWSGKCQVRDSKRKIHNVETRVEKVGQSFVLYLYAGPLQTSEWAVGTARFDVELRDSTWTPHWKQSVDGLTKSSITQTFQIIEDVTQ